MELPIAAPPTPPTTAPTGPPTSAPPTAPVTPPVTAPLSSANAVGQEAQRSVAVATPSIHRDIETLHRSRRINRLNAERFQSPPHRTHPSRKRQGYTVDGIELDEDTL